MTRFKLLAITLTVFLMSCGEAGKIEKLKKELKEKKQELASVNKEILDLQTEIALLDTTAKENTIPVKVDTLGHSKFSNMVTLQGLVKSDKNIRMSSEVPGRIEKIYVREGQKVSFGQALVKMNSEMISSQINELKSALKLAQATYEKQNRLWQKEIGSEIQLLQAKTNYENLQKAIETARVQLNKHLLTAPSNGYVENILSNEGQMAAPGLPLIEMTNNKTLELNLKVSEKFLGKLTKGQTVEIQYPSISKTFKEKIDAIGSVIDQNSRTFNITIRPKNGIPLLKPNMLALVNLPSFQAEQAINIPTKLIRQDSRGNFVLSVNSNKQVEKVYIKIEEQFADKTIIKSGVTVGQLIITEGFTNVIPGDLVKIISSKRIE